MAVVVVVCLRGLSVWLNVWVGVALLCRCSGHLSASTAPHSPAPLCFAPAPAPATPAAVSPTDIQLVELVGEGSFGEVWLAEYCGALVAVKILAKVRSDNMTRSMQHQLALRHLTKEVMLMSKLRHPNGECAPEL